MIDILDKIEGLKFIKTPEFSSSGSLVLDYIVSGKMDGKGGWPLGQIVEIIGEPASGKSYICGRSIAMFQEKYGQDALIFYDDTEAAANSSWMETLGVKFDNTFLCSSLHTEAVTEFTRLIMNIKEPWSSSVTATQCFKRLRAMCEHEALKDKKLLFIVDSIGNLSCTYEMEHEGDRVDQGQRAKEIKQSIRLSIDVIAKRQALLLVTNHLISGPGGYGDNKYAGGGGGLKFGSTIRVEFGNPGKIKEEKDIIGVRLFVQTIKSRYTPPFSRAELNMYWDKAIPKYDGVVDKLVELGEINQNGGWFSLKDSEEKVRKADLSARFEAGEFTDILERVSK